MRHLTTVREYKMLKTTLVTFALFIYFHAYAGEGHDAGEEWAEENGITDISDCSGNSNSFIEGCEDYVNQLEQEQEEYEQEE